MNDNEFSLKGKNIVLTGAIGYLGSKYAEGLSKFGANVILADINLSKAEKMKKILEEKFSTNPLAIKVDISNKKSVQQMASKICKKYKSIDVLINNAFYQETKKEKTSDFENFSLDAWEKSIRVNLTGTLICCQEIGKIMKKQKNGNIINISSVYGLLGADQRIYEKSGWNSTIAYGTTKSAILNMTRYLASYWHNDGIRVNSLSLGGVERGQGEKFLKKYSEKTMIGRMAKQDEYVGAIIFLSSNSSSYMTGSNLVIDGGWTAW
jgi:NAD(P)-dependent dehydrogenase (short-subunit alcohol dehydrogenase family)|tara:strand:- start:227 stop:1021 length:795 start_codon:yes stop_codon:yes gene_type:complete